ncbi:MAG: T9SS type A sorting domain-containing protein [Bacteroidetes bacterium]|nr:T9SS type A sorting domain-containing protein [Bacteroidota bacterium]
MKFKPLRFFGAALIITCLFVNPIQTSAQQTAHYNTYVSDKINGYYDYLPDGYKTGNNKYPLYIVLQGISQLGDGSAGQLEWLLGVWGSPPWLIANGKFPSSFTVNGQTSSFIVFTPQFKSAFWSTDILDVINYCKKNYRVDESKIYMSGISMGGGALWDFISSSVANAKLLAAAVPISGSAAPSQSAANNIANANLPVWGTTSSQDPVVSPSNTIGWIADINNAPTPPNPLAKLTVFQVSEPDHSFAGAQTYDPKYTENGINLYQWMLQYSRAGALPVSQFDLNLVKKDNQLVLHWQTKGELNSKGFEVQKSKDGVSFETISFVNSTSINGAEASYQYADNAPYNGKNYYRLKQVDQDQNYKFSPVRFIDFSTAGYVKVFPNPVEEILNINTNINFERATLNITDMKGQVILKTNISGSGTITVPLNKFVPGMYVARISDGKDSYNVTFIKK